MRVKRCNGRVWVALKRLDLYWNDSVHMQRWNSFQRATVWYEPGLLKLGRFVIGWNAR